MKHDSLERWTSDHAADLYGIRNWGSGYFDISSKGEVVVRLPHARHSEGISLMSLLAGLKDRGMTLPLLLRFSNILDDRITLLNESFLGAIRACGYKGGYRGIYPIKVNQQQQVVEEIARFGQRYHHGLEAGSKAELIAALATLKDPDAYLVCNGYKDEEFIALALHGLKLGLQTIIVLEMPGELDLVLRQAEKMGVRPRIGIRVKLSARAGGRWTDSGGDRSVFGLTAAEVIDVVDKLRAANMLDCLQMVHYHIGSQVPNIVHVRTAIAEAARFYVDLVKEGAAMGIIDIGGGLAVDYDGSHTNFASSRNYDVNEYCTDVIEGIMAVTDPAGVPHPVILSESGRALVAYYSVLLFNILDTSRFESHGLPEMLPEDAPDALRNLVEVDGALTAKNLQECYHDAVYYRDEIRSGFLHGAVTLRHRALGEQVFWHIAMRISREIGGMKYVPDELQGLETALADVYYGNFSVFQSLPDSWAIEQLFPIMPIHRLDERPTRQATFSDITCDCDGKIDRFIDLHDVKHALPLHEVADGSEYVLGAFLIGAYQETLGDLHNLFGDPHVVSVRLNHDGEIEYSHELQGDSVADVLSYVEYDPRTLVAQFRDLAENAVRARKITPQERREIVEAYEAGLRGYTYFEP